MTRQAVSNWERNRNLPELEILLSAAGFWGSAWTAALWSPAGGGRRPRQTGGGARLPPGRCGPSGRRCGWPTSSGRSRRLRRCTINMTTLRRAGCCSGPP
ncbi:MAG: hypothetical protein ACLRIS_10655 [Flavonifractor plautii]